jgi:hypothetical protein
MRDIFDKPGMAISASGINHGSAVPKTHQIDRRILRACQLTPANLEDV